MGDRLSQTEAPRIFDPAYYERIFGFEERHWWSRGMRRAMLGLLRGRLHAAGSLRLLDVGCGTGHLLGYLARTFSASPVGADASLYALQFCRQRGLMHLAAAGASELPFPASTFDLVLCVDTLQHVAPAGADRKAFAEFARLLVPGGVLYLRTNSAVGHRRLRGVDPDLYRRYRRRQLVELATAAGLDVERATYLNCLPSLWTILKELADRRAGEAPASGPALAIELQSGIAGWLGEILYGLLLVEAWWVGWLGRDLPFGHSLALVARRRVRRSETRPIMRRHI